MGTDGLPVQPRLPNLALSVATALMLALFLDYAFVETYRIIETHV